MSSNQPVSAEWVSVGDLFWERFLSDGSRLAVFRADQDAPWWEWVHLKPVSTLIDPTGAIACARGSGHELSRPARDRADAHMASHDGLP